jgi:NAD(P)-dependent dehydrogenase (short-subunit alcohol dehydrogenase family)
VTAAVGPLPKEFDMHGKPAIITDASRGLGLGMATNLARDGVGVLGTYRASKGRADDLVAEITSLGGTAAMLQLDTGRIDEFPAFYAEVKSTLADTFDCGDFDFLVNNAGG